MSSSYDSGDEHFSDYDEAELNGGSVTKMIVDMALGSRGDHALVMPDNTLFSDFNGMSQTQRIKCQLTYFRLVTTQSQMPFPMNRRLPMKVAQEQLDRFKLCSLLTQVIHGVNRGLLRLWESGVLRHVLAKYKPRAPSCGAASKASYKPASLQYVYVAFVLQVVGCLIALFLGLLECIVASTPPRKKLLAK